jgi:ethanolamine utilization microcompartment shell protein EutL
MKKTILSAVVSVIMLTGPMTSSVLAGCAEKIQDLEKQIEEYSGNNDRGKNIAVKMINKAKKKLAAGKVGRCEVIAEKAQDQINVAFGNN